MCRCVSWGLFSFRKVGGVVTIMSLSADHGLGQPRIIVPNHSGECPSHGDGPSIISWDKMDSPCRASIQLVAVKFGGKRGNICFDRKSLA